MKVSNSTESRVHGPDVGRVSVTLVDRNNNKSDHMFMNEEQWVFFNLWSPYYPNYEAEYFDTKGYRLILCYELKKNWG